jgi:hypothetical protein
MQGDRPCPDDPEAFASTEQTQKRPIKLSANRETSSRNRKPDYRTCTSERGCRDSSPRMPHNLFNCFGLNGASGEICTPGRLVPAPNSATLQVLNVLYVRKVRHNLMVQSCRGVPCHKSVAEDGTTCAGNTSSECSFTVSNGKPIIASPAKRATNRAQSEHGVKVVQRMRFTRFELDGFAA